MKEKAVILLSGGLDSATCLAFAISEGYACYALSFDYGQKNRAELQAAQRVAQSLGAHSHQVFPVPLSRLGGSALTNEHASIPKASPREFNDIPVTYVPARNTVFLSIGLAMAEAVSAESIFIGVNAVDYSGYPDCRPEYIAVFRRLAELATKSATLGRSINIQTPLITLSKAEIIGLGDRLGVDYALTCSCYQPTSLGQACGECDSCHLRQAGFVAAGVDDPTVYK